MNEYRLSQAEILTVLERVFGAEVTITEDGVLLRSDKDISSVLEYMIK